MNDYIFWQDFFDTYQSFPDWLKVFWALVLLAIALGLPGLFMLYRLEVKRRESLSSKEKLVYTVTADAEGNLNIITHDDAQLPPPPQVDAQLAQSRPEKTDPQAPTHADILLRAEVPPSEIDMELRPTHLTQADLLLRAETAPIKAEGVPLAPGKLKPSGLQAQPGHWRGSRR